MMSEKMQPAADVYPGLHDNIVALLESARSAAARSVNALMTATYWEVGRRIVEFDQGGEGRAIYGQALIKRLSLDLIGRFGRGFSERNIEQMRSFYLCWSPEHLSRSPSSPLHTPHIPQTLSAKSPEPLIEQTVSAPVPDLRILATMFPLPWSAYVRLLSVKNPLARSFYEAEALRCGWSVRQLDRQISSQFYERTALSRDKAAMLHGRHILPAPRTPVTSINLDLSSLLKKAANGVVTHEL
jgi:hypothetical protein